MICDKCGKLINKSEIGGSKYIPDSEFTSEDIEYYCKKCVHKVIDSINTKPLDSDLGGE